MKARQFGDQWTLNEWGLISSFYPVLSQTKKNGPFNPDPWSVANPKGFPGMAGLVKPVLSQWSSWMAGMPRIDGARIFV